MDEYYFMYKFNSYSLIMIFTPHVLVLFVGLGGIMIFSINLHFFYKFHTPYKSQNDLKDNNFLCLNII